MLETVKSLLKKWQVQVLLVGGAVVVATQFGTCTFEPGDSTEDEAQMEPVSNDVSVEATTTVTNPVEETEVEVQAETESVPDTTVE